MRSIPHLTSCLAAAAAFLSITSFGEAAIEINISNSAPLLDHIYTYRDVSSTEVSASVSAYRNTNNSFRAVGQAFNTKGELDAVAISGITFNIKSFSVDTLGKAFSLSIYQAPSLTDNPSSDNSTRIFHDTGVLPDEFANDDYISFMFSSEQQLAPGFYYTVVFDFLSPTENTGNLHLKTVGTDNNNAPLNRIWASTSPGTWGYTSATNGLVMYVHTAIPEPSTTALLIGSLVSGIGGYTWRRTRL